MIAIIKTGSTYPELAARRGDFDDWMRTGLGLDGDTAPTIDVQRGDALPDPSDLAGVVVTGSHNMVTDRELWSEQTAVWLRELIDRQVPTLGICYGHQLLAYAAGGLVGELPELGAVRAALTHAAATDPLLGDLPTTFTTLNGHFQGVLQLPAGAVRLAATAVDPNHAFRIGVCIWGIQFHPEIDVDIMQCYLERSRPDLAALGMDTDALLHALTPAPVAASVLGRFAAFVACSASRSHLRTEVDTSCE